MIYYTSSGCRPAEKATTDREFHELNGSIRVIRGVVIFLSI